MTTYMDDVRVRPKVGDRVLARHYGRGTEGTVIKFALRFKDDRGYDMALVELDGWLCRKREWICVDELFPLESV